jgi:hypothetical protein
MAPLPFPLLLASILIVVHCLQKDQYSNSNHRWLIHPIPMIVAMARNNSVVPYHPGYLHTETVQLGPIALSKNQRFLKHGTHKPMHALFTWSPDFTRDNFLVNVEPTYD